MALDERYVVGINLGEYYVDKDTGEPLAGGTIEFKRDADHSTGKLAFQLSGSYPNYTYTSLPNPMTLSAVGTPQNASNENVAIYFYPYITVDGVASLDLYYIEVKDSAGTVQFTREAWPNLTAGTDPVEAAQGKVTNELGNPQFVDIYLTSDVSHTFTLTVASQAFNIAPDWDLVLTGTIGNTVAVIRNTLTGNLGAPSDPATAEIVNPPYDLLVTPNAGITSVKLRQRLNHNPGLFSGGYISGYMIAKSESGNDIAVSMSYQESDGSSAVAIASNSVSNTAYTEIKGSVLFPPSTNADSATDGYLDILVDLPNTANIRVSSVQVVGMDQDTDIAPYDQEPVNRQIDHTWHNYKEQVVVYAKDSILTGWQFGTNPWQFRSPTVAASGAGAVGAAFAAYTADQTIIVEENTTMLNVGRAAGTNHNSTYTITPAGGTQGKFALVQFVDAETTRPYWAYLMSALVRARLSTSLGTAIKFKVDLIYSDTAPSAINPIASWGSTGADIVYTGQWTRVPCNLDNTYTFLNENGVGGSIAGLPTYSFDRYALPISTSGARYLGIVLHTIDGTLGAGDSLAIEDISLVPNDFGMVANPKTFDQTLQECEYYYEKSYAMSVLPGTATANDSLLAPMVKDFLTNTMYLHAKAFGFPYKNVKRVTPTLTLYSVAGTSANVSGYLYSGAGNATSTAADIAATSWSPTTTTRTTNFDPNSAAILATYGTFATNKADNVWIQYHYVADSRL